MDSPTDDGRTRSTSGLRSVPFMCCPLPVTVEGKCRIYRQIHLSLRRINNSSSPSFVGYRTEAKKIKVALDLFAAGLAKKSSSRQLQKAAVDMGSDITLSNATPNKSYTYSTTQQTGRRPERVPGTLPSQNREYRSPTPISIRMQSFVDNKGDLHTLTWGEVWSAGWEIYAAA